MACIWLRYHVLTKASIAEVYVALGDKDQAFAWLRKAAEERPRLLTNVKIGPKVDGLRSDQRYSELLRRIG